MWEDRSSAKAFCGCFSGPCLWITTGKIRFLGCTVSRNSTHTPWGLLTTPSCQWQLPELGGEPWLPKHLCDRSAQRPALCRAAWEQAQCWQEMCVYKYSLSHRLESLNDDRNNSPSLDSPGSTVSHLPWSKRPVLTAQLPPSPPNISFLHSTSLL